MIFFFLSLSLGFEKQLRMYISALSLINDLILRESSSSFSSLSLLLLFCQNFSAGIFHFVFLSLAQPMCARVVCVWNTNLRRSIKTCFCVCVRV